MAIVYLANVTVKLRHKGELRVLILILIIITLRKNKKQKQTKKKQVEQLRGGQKS
jgi:hypothetical protein